MGLVEQSAKGPTPVELAASAHMESEETEKHGLMESPVMQPSASGDEKGASDSNLTAKTTVGRLMSGPSESPDDEGFKETV